MWSLYDLDKLHNQNLIKFSFNINSTIFSLKKKQYIQSLNFMIHILSYILLETIYITFCFSFFFIYLFYYTTSEERIRIQILLTGRTWLLYVLSFLHTWFWQYNEKIIGGFIAFEVVQVNLIIWNFLPMLHSQLNYVRLSSQVNLIRMLWALT